MKIRTLAAALAVACSSYLSAQEPAKPAAPPMPTPAAEMKTLGVFEGDWACEGQVPASPFGPAGKMRGTVSSKIGHGGFWQSGVVRSSMDGMPGSMEGTFHMTYDASGKRFMMLWVDSMGSWATSTSKGWEGDALTFEGETTMGGQKLVTKDVFTRQADGSLKHSMSMQMGGNWTPTGEETCRKAAKK
jgi:hypothetical protein